MFNVEDIFVKENIFSVAEEDGHTVMNIELPFTKKEEISVGQMEGDILLTIRNERRRFQIPENVKERNLDHFEYKNGLLKVYLL